MYPSESEESQPVSMAHRVSQYYAVKAGAAFRRTNPRVTRWGHSGASMIGWLSRFGSALDLPIKSIALFAGSWLMLEIGWPVLTLLGVATAGSVWSIPSAIPFLFIIVYGIILVSGCNLVRSIVVYVSGTRDNLVKVLFRGYFWSLLSVALILLINQYFHTALPFLYLLPIIYLLPLDVLGTTVPIPIPLGLSGWYLDILVVVIVYVVGITGSCIGGLEILRYFIDSSAQQSSYHAILSVLFLAVFPTVNIQFSLMFLDSILDLFGRVAAGA